MRWKARVITVVIAVLVWVLAVPRISEVAGFMLYLTCAIAIAAAVGPVLCRWAATIFTDLIFSTHGSTAPADINDTTTYNQSENVFSLLRTISVLVLAAALYGIFWSVPILLQWPAIDSLTVMPPRLIAALGVGIFSALAWLFFLGVYFIPEIYRNIRDLWWSWRYPVEEVPTENAEDQPRDS